MMHGESVENHKGRSTAKADSYFLNRRYPFGSQWKEGQPYGNGISWEGTTISKQVFWVDNLINGFLAASADMVFTNMYLIFILASGRLDGAIEWPVNIWQSHSGPNFCMDKELE